MMILWYGGHQQTAVGKQVIGLAEMSVVGLYGAFKGRRKWIKLCPAVQVKSKVIKSLAFHANADCIFYLMSKRATWELLKKRVKYLDLILERSLEWVCGTLVGGLKTRNTSYVPSLTWIICIYQSE